MRMILITTMTKTISTKTSPNTLPTSTLNKQITSKTVLTTKTSKPSSTKTCCWQNITQTISTTPPQRNFCNKTQVQDSAISQSRRTSQWDVVLSSQKLKLSSMMMKKVLVNINLRREWMNHLRSILLAGNKYKGKNWKKKSITCFFRRINRSQYKTN